MKNALQIIEDAEGRNALVYVDRNNFTMAPIYKPEVTEIIAQPDEFHTVEGKKQPKRDLVDRIGTAAGVTFIDSLCKVEESRAEAIKIDNLDLPDRPVFTGRACGKVLMSDGSWRQSSVEEYQFDPILRATAEGGDTKKKLNYLRFAASRAATGARLRVIRQLVGMPVAFNEPDTRRPMVFARIVRNTDFIMQTPEGRAAAISVALGVAPQLFGNQQPQQIERPQRDVTGEIPINGGDGAHVQALPASSSSSDWVEKAEPAEQGPDIDLLVTSLEDLLANYRTKLKPKGIEMAEAAVRAREPNAIIACLKGIKEALKANYGIKFGDES